MVDFDQQNNSEEQAKISASERLAQLRAQAWFGWLLWTILVVIIVLVIIFGVRAIRHHHNTSNSVPTATNQSGSRPNFSTGNSKAAKGSNSSSSNNSNSSKTNSSANSNSAASGPSLKNGQQLTDTGPGDVLAIFLGVSFAAAALHYLSGSRRKI